MLPLKRSIKSLQVWRPFPARCLFFGLFSNMSSDKFYILCEFINENDLHRTDEMVTTPVRVGFSEWVQFEEGKPKKSIESLIRDKDEILLKWPSNYDVGCKEIMSKYHNVEWITAVAIIIAQENEWEQIRECEKCMLKNKPYMDSKMMTKAARKAPPLKTNEKASSTSKNECGSKKRKRLSVQGHKGNQESEKRILENDDSSDDSLYESVHHNVKRYLTQTKDQRAKKIVSKSDAESVESSGDDSDVDQLHKRAEQTSNLQAQNHWIKKELNTLRATKVFSETDFVGLKKEMRGMKDDIKELRREMKSILKDELKRLWEEMRSLIRKCQNCACSTQKAEGIHQNKPGTFKLSPPSAVPTVEPLTLSDQSSPLTAGANEIEGVPVVAVQRKVPIGNSPLTAAGIDGEFTAIDQPSFKNHLDWTGVMGQSSVKGRTTSSEGSSSVDISESSLFVKDKSRDTSEVAPKINKTESIKSKEVEPQTVISTVKDIEAIETAQIRIPAVQAGLTKKNGKKPRSSKQTDNGDSKRRRTRPEIDPKAIFKFGALELTGTELGRCRHTGKISSLATDIFSSLFTKKEMALCNLTGRIPNGHLQLFPKGKLDEARINGIIDYMAEFLKTEFDRDTVAKEVKKTISNKLCNFGKSTEAKEIVQEEYERRQREQAAAATVPPPTVVPGDVVPDANSD